MDTVHVLDGPFDFIIGLPTIRRYDLTVKLRHLFVECREDSLTAVQAHLAVLHTTPGGLSPLSDHDTRPVTDARFRSDLHLYKYAKADLLELLQDDDENPEWKEDLSDMLPKPGEKCDDCITPTISGRSPFHKKTPRPITAPHGRFYLAPSMKPLPTLN